MLSTKFGHILDGPLSSLARRINADPNTITITGFAVSVLAAVVLSKNLLTGGILLIISAFLDLLDGVLARVNDKATDFGAFLDSVLDRYSDAFLMSGFALYFVKNGPMTGATLSIATMIGAFVISYTKARAEGLGKECHTGLMERPERILLMTFGALSGWILPVMWIMTVFTHITVVQRIMHVRKAMQ